MQRWPTQSRLMRTAAGGDLMAKMIEARMVRFAWMGDIVYWLLKAVMRMKMLMSRGMTVTMTRMAKMRTMM